MQSFTFLKSKLAMKTKLIIIIFAVLPSFINAEPLDDGWFEVGNSNYNAILESIHYIDDNTGFAVGSGGAFLKTTDGGFNWTAYDIGHYYNFKKIVFTDSNIGFLFGTIQIGSNNRTAILKSTDGGDTWNKILGPDGIGAFNDVHFPPDFNANNTAYFVTAGSNNFYKTTDGGNTWNNLDISKGFYKTQFFNESEGIATYASMGSSSLAITDDGGLTWTDVDIDGLGQGRAVFAVNDKVAYVASINRISYTTDAGETWSTPVNVSNMDWFSIKLHFSSETTGYRYDNSGVISKTTDSGESWTEFYSDSKYPANSIFTRSSGQVDFVSSGGANFTSDGTNPFVKRMSGIINGSLNNAWFFNEEQGIAVGDNGTVLKTENTGTTWNNYDSGADYRLTGLYFTSEDVGYISGEGSVRKTLDGGENWDFSSSGISYAPIHSIFFTSETTGYTAGSRTFKTTNGGDNWTEIHDSFGRKIFFADDNTGYIIAASGVMRKTTDAGATWNDLTTGTSWHLYGVYFLSPEIGFIGSSHANIYKTIDGGQNWSQVHNGPTGLVVNDIHFIDENQGYAVGNQGYIVKTEDGGNTWEQVNSNTIRDLFAIDITPGGTPFVVGQDGIVLRKTSSYTLTFNVTDTESNPIEDAVVTLNGIPYTAGHYEFPGLIADDYTYSITKAGYSVESGTATIVDEDLTIDITLEPSYKATFSVLSNYYSSPIQGAVINAGALGNATTNASGIAVIENIEPGDNYSFEVIADNFLLYEETFDIVDGDIVIQVLLDADIDAPFALPATDLTPFGFRANWDEVVEADEYLLYVSADDFENHLIDGQEVDITDYIIVSASPDTEYKYRLRAINQYGVSGFSNEITVVTLSLPIPEIPVAIAATEVTQTGFTANWETADFAEGYLLYVSDDDFTTHLDDYDGKDITELSEEIIDLEPGTLYKYRLRAYNTEGESDFSNTIEVTTESLVFPDIPVATDATDVSQTGFTANWESVDNADGYFLYVSEDDFVTHLDGYDGKDISVLFEEVTDLEPETTYKYRVKAYNADGESDFSNTIEVTTESLVFPDIPVATDATDVSQTGFTANWESADNADGYLLYVSEDDFVTHIDDYYGKDISGLSESITGLEPGTLYKYRLKAYNENGESDFSNIIEVNTEEISNNLDNLCKSNIMIYPNPAKNYINIGGISSKSQIEIFSTDGKKIMSFIVFSDYIIDASNMERGMYIIRISSKELELNKRILIY